MTTTDSAPKIPADRSIPEHIAVIMDGNGRWAKARGLPRIAGHRKGLEMVREMVKACAETGVRHLTLFAFSSENWRRPEREVQLLMDLFGFALDNEVAKLHTNNIRFRTIGDIARFGNTVARKVREAELLTANNTRLQVTIAVNYGGRWDIARACIELARRAVAGEIQPEDISPEVLQQFLSLSDLPEPDLFIRTGGEQRISNFLLWQLAYTELYFTTALWPDFGRTEFDAALKSYVGRQRRFGHTGEQIEAARRV
ncbi:MAG: polyprenyl diphosphate synthase [Acidiferrobacteraceae bacterium]